MTPHWVCQICRAPIAGDGIVTIGNANEALGPIDHYPIDATPAFEPQSQPPPGGFVGHSASELVSYLDRPINIRFRVMHAKCAPEPDPGAYWFHTPATLDGYVGWVLHLFEKNWMGRDDLYAMLAFWWRHKNEQPPSTS